MLFPLTTFLIYLALGFVFAELHVPDHDFIPAHNAHKLTSLGGTSNNTTYAPSIQKRWEPSPANGVEWNKALCKGRILLNMMWGSDAEAGQLLQPPQASARSRFQSIMDFPNWGYFLKKANIRNPKCDMSSIKDGYGLERVLNALSVRTGKEAWTCVRSTHGNPDVAAGFDPQTYHNPDTNTLLRVSGAWYMHAINDRDGVLIIAKQYGPSHMAQYRRPPIDPTHFPALRQSSDIAYLNWFLSRPPTVNPIRYIITWSITNGLTQRIIFSAMGGFDAPDRPLRPYPYLSFDPNSEQGSAILGSPNGVGIGFLLAQHKAELGRMSVSRIHVFQADTNPADGLNVPSILWELASVPS